KAPDGMVRVPGGEVDINLPGLDHLKPIELGAYRIGRHEVTNAEFKEFVESGGYRTRELWEHPFVLAGKPLSWEDAMARFTDRTGRPGPAGWEVGDYPKGEKDYPVTGVSWYEAAAYAKYRGARLPTVYHWSRAAFTWASSGIVPLSNLAGNGLASVGRYRGMGPYGTYDMAGNAREWCLNQTGGERYILGGGWNDPTYAFNDAYAQSPFDRSATNGFRLMRYLDDKNLDLASRPIDRLFRDFSKERPVSDPVFDIYRRMYDYDRTSLNSTVEAVDSSAEEWVREKVAFDAAYGHERVTAYLFLPKRGKPPFQTMVYFPGSNAIHDRFSSRSLQTGTFDFIVKSGRAVMYPVYKSTYERGDSLRSDYAEETNDYRDHVIMWAKDLRRSIDYLATRADIDSTRLAYYGVSWGGYLGGLMPAVEPRLKTSILVVAGLEFQRGLPEVEPINFLPRIRIPVLMLNGQYDHYFPVETSQRPFFRFLGTPPEHKRMVISEGGHNVPRTQWVRETLDWLDRYLGPVQ
ncbi:MAG TPA: SUMF1/EgtB/PvdO family nonheme iron enzyme, partial [Gemmatimonadales bacterium]|nr:SUMF1/EgtB/PvdO family nonheme iron enzyme [Gemmatimonadales bacterium]